MSHPDGPRAPRAGASRRSRDGRVCTLRNAYLGAGGLLLVLYLFVPPLQGSTVLFSSLSGSSAVAILVGVHRNRPDAAWPWRCFALAQALFFLGDVYTNVYPKVVGHEVPFPSLGDGL